MVNEFSNRFELETLYFHEDVATFLNFPMGQKPSRRFWQEPKKKIKGGFLEVLLFHDSDFQ